MQVFPLEIVVLPTLLDNYCYLLHDKLSGSTAVVDPGEAVAVEVALAKRQWKLTHILNTHHHPDHINGNLILKKNYNAILIGPKAEINRIPNLDITLVEGSTYNFAGHIVSILDTPGHTSGHISLYLADSQVLFTGDTLFSLGCGKMFEGTAAQFLDSLLKLSKLPDSTKIYCGHEYTSSNARFALSIDYNNAALKKRSKEVHELLAKNQPTVPSVLNLEKATNPFLRVKEPTIALALDRPGADPVEIFADLRKRKDNF
ncbi:hydroxyacylglutathione hydrolase [Candidatus Endolissoclinum faulkneri L2]|uniref:Hydroxyacylglutathione hydrolase n=1 Tax=Candidatus Endolissoclinum faulkneri L2 TaxID=1193729 RepID=K7YJ49_9PROT|nr:hydroxyacylglutathione hydrolase [Candidatus Endolissoclinum faulkneri]AFX99670.1 hydroxyacylglutathione hydrolase [Candidatus Endolissoclinum faulkneri L2]